MKVKSKSPWTPESAPSFWINHASRTLMRRFEQRLRPLGFGMAYFPVVIALEENGSLLQKELARLANIEQPTMAALLIRMERDELIVREPHLTDKRASWISLTAKAKARLPEAKEIMRQVSGSAISGFNESERTMFLQLLQRVAKNLDEPIEH